MNEKLKNQQMENLLRAVLSLKNMDEAYAFFEDLCTVTELKSMSQRFEVARLLSEGHVYGDVVKIYTRPMGNANFRRRREDHRRFDRDDQPRQPRPELRQRRIPPCL